MWPKLQVISCWTHGPSELYAENLRSQFPNVEIQGKGLVATEAFVSLPFHEDKDPVLAVTSHFFEFQDAAGEKLSLAHELIAGKTYRVIVTTGGGLYRYPLGDLVRVTGFIQDAPCLRFIGREANVSDLFGEKLQGTFVEGVIRRALAQQNINPRFFLLAPVCRGHAEAGLHTVSGGNAVLDAAILQRNLEEGLAENFHYKHCRRLGQLSGARDLSDQPGTHSPPRPSSSTKCCPAASSLETSRWALSIASQVGRNALVDNLFLDPRAPPRQTSAGKSQPPPP